MTSVTFAYIDAGTGSYLLAVIAGGVAMAWFFIRARLSTLARRFRRANDDSSGSHDV